MLAAARRFAARVLLDLRVNLLRDLRRARVAGGRGRRETRRAKRRARDGVVSSRARRPARGAERAGPRRARTCAAAAAFAPRQGGPSADDDALRDGRTRARTSSLIVFLTVFGARKVRWRFEMGLAFLAALVGLRMPWAMAALVYIALKPIATRPIEDDHLGYAKRCLLHMPRNA